MTDSVSVFLRIPRVDFISHESFKNKHQLQHNFGYSYDLIISDRFTSYYRLSVILNDSGIIVFNMRL